MKKHEFKIYVENYIKERTLHFSLVKKIHDITNFFEKNGIKNVVLGISGGIDSALVLALLNEVSKNINLNIYAKCIIFNDIYESFDISHYHSIQKLFEHNKNIYFEIDSITKYHKLVNIDSNNKHLLAQASYAFRYHKMFISAQEIGNCIVCGTTNLDEFSFSGWFGKHSDMVVDIQPIIDMHKSEVYLASKELNIPDSIVKREPQGDLIDGSSDVENFGCSYDELSFISYIMCHQYKDTKFDDNKLEIIKYIKDNFNKLIELNNRNSHKYHGQTFSPIMIIESERFFFYKV